MDASTLFALTREALWLALVTASPPLGAALLVGLLSSVAQTATQIQETTLSSVPKLCAGALALAVTAPWVGARLERFASQLLTALAQVAT